MQVKVALVQQAAVFFDKEKGLQQLAHWSAEAAKVREVFDSRMSRITENAEKIVEAEKAEVESELN